MDHLDEYGNSGAIHRVDVFRVVPDDVLDNRLNPSRFTFAHFNSFPNDVGWDLRGSELKRRPESPLKTLGELLQAWLFFGLVFTVVRIDNDPLLEVAMLLESNREKISTRVLEEKLKVWTRWAVAVDSIMRSRWIKVGLVLQKARAVILRYCSDDGEQWDEAERYDSRQEIEKPENYMTDSVALSLMLLGETLSAIHDNLMRKRCGGVSGWHSYDVPGWGHPRYVIKEMEKMGWCPRNIHLLRRQLGGNATLLLAAYYSHRQNSAQVDKRWHEKCDKKVCHAKSEDDQKSYVTAHHGAVCDKERQLQCESSKALGPDMDKVTQILDKEDPGVFPLLKFRCKQIPNSNLTTIEELEVVEGGKGSTKYVTISHVWSDGYGNEKENKLWRCQLQLIRLLLKQVEEETMPFWMDTLLIPVASQHDDDKRRKKKAIQQIFTVFKESECTIVLDKGLISLPIGNSQEPCLTAMKILASGWMRRLWTLQEAVLSKKLVVAFEEGSVQSGRWQVYSNIRNELRKQATKDTSVIAGLIQKELAWSVADDAEINEQPLEIKIANSWRAARWRTTSNPTHETLALATLLGIQTTKSRSDKITEAGMYVLSTSKEDTRTRKSMDRHDLMVEFWKSVDRFKEGCIPAGIIFLPGKRLGSDRFQGFGWAPETFMTPEEVPHPDPLSLLKHPTTLRFDREMHVYHGLVVTCPGFLLHLDDDDTENRIRATILSSVHVTEPGADNFVFPVNNNFNEWYGVNPIPETGNTSTEAPLGRQSQLGIILSRSSPRESPREVGLLVEIYEKPGEASDRDRGVHFAQILHPVSIRRLSNHPSMDEYMARQCAIFGEMVSDSQKWCVDGFRLGRFSNDRAKAAGPHSPKARKGNAGSFMLRINLPFLS